jgi:putative salt-induced outer membrane protein YdiY
MGVTVVTGRTSRVAIAAGVVFLGLGFVSAARGDTVELTDGNKLTGHVGNIAGGKMKFSSDSLGEITLDLGKVKSFSTEAPARVQVKRQAPIEGKITAGDATKIDVEGHGEIPLASVKQVNPPPQKWTGSVVVNGNLARGNTHSEGVGATGNATLRRDNEWNNDRVNFQGAYNYSRQRDPATGDVSTSADNWFALGKYDLFFGNGEKTYGYVNLRYDHDRIAELEYRLTPGAGVGYQWVERPDFNFNTEAGVSYVYEQYSNDGATDRVALRLAYHVDKQVNDRVSVFHNLEWLPAFNDPSDYNLNADLGARAKLVENIFAELKVQYQRDSTPAPGAQKDDVRFLLGVGWTF